MLAEAIGYPEKVPAGAWSFTFRVDGAGVYAEETEGRVVLSMALEADVTDASLRTLARYAAGRMLKEEATLAYGEIEGQKPGARPSAFLWQEMPVRAGKQGLLRLFETFMDSCDWWRERVVAEGQPSAAADHDTMVIRP